jgi:hypothetical protein
MQSFFCVIASGTYSQGFKGLYNQIKKKKSSIYMLIIKLSKFVQEVKLLTCIWEVSALNLNQNTYLHNQGCSPCLLNLPD